MNSDLLDRRVKPQFSYLKIYGNTFLTFFERFKRHDVDYQHNGKGGSLSLFPPPDMDLTMILATVYLEGQCQTQLKVNILVEEQAEGSRHRGEEQLHFTHISPSARRAQLSTKEIACAIVPPWGGEEWRSLHPTFSPQGALCEIEVSIFPHAQYDRQRATPQDSEKQRKMQDISFAASPAL